MKRFAHEFMNKAPVFVQPSMTVRDLARFFLRNKEDSVCVLDGDDLAGVVTTMDLVFREKSVASEGIVGSLLNRASRGKAELTKITSSTVGEIMTRNPVTVWFDDPMDKIASTMVDKHYTILPVLKGDAVVGVIRKHDLIRAAFEFED